MDITLRPLTPEDEPFVAELFAVRLPPEVRAMPIPPAQMAVLVQGRRGDPLQAGAAAHG